MASRASAACTLERGTGLPAGPPPWTRRPGRAVSLGVPRRAAPRRRITVAPLVSGKRALDMTGVVGGGAVGCEAAALGAVRLGRV